MTTAQRAYINKEYNQYVDDECLQFRSIPMAVVNKILKPNRPVSDFTGVKRVFNNVPARPINLNALATSVARMNNLPYSHVDAISMKIGEEETQAVKAFVKGNKDPFEVPVKFAPQPYVYEKAVRSSSGEPLTPEVEKMLGFLSSRFYDKAVMSSSGVPKKAVMSSSGKYLTNKERLSFLQNEVGVPVPQYHLSGKVRRAGIGKRQVALGVINDIMNAVEQTISKKNEVQLLLGDEAQSYNTPPMGSTLREHIKQMDEPKLVDFYSRPQFISERTGMLLSTGKAPEKPYIDRMADKRAKEIMRMSRVDERGSVQYNFPKGEEDVRAYLGIEPSPQVGHTTQKMDSIFGSSHSK